MLSLLFAAAFAASPCQITDHDMLLRLASEFTAASPHNELVLLTLHKRYMRQRVRDDAVQFTVVTTNVSPYTISVFSNDVTVFVQGRIRSAGHSCAEAQRTLSDYFAATAR